ncbi:MAG: preprotein translocase subunit SecY [Clostridia bacterium]|nr:preprotein translocase subunit SecY [Clostridia bacterium]
MLDYIRKLWKIEDLRKKILYTFGMLILFRLVGCIPAPGIDLARLGMGGNDLPLLDIMNMMTGGAMSQMTIMAMGISPYINASIIMQLLCIALPVLERMQQEEGGREKINRISRYVTIALAVIQAIGLSNGLGYAKDGLWNNILIGISMAGGTALAMWIGERITDKGIGNGISLLIFAGIVSNLFNGIVSGFRTASTISGLIGAVVILVVLVILTFVVTFIDLGERRIPLQIAKQVKGRRVYGGQNTHMTLKVISVGVMPLIFAYSFLSFPGTIGQLVAPNSGFTSWCNTNLVNGAWFHLILSAVLIFAFTFFYSSISFDAKKQAEQLQQQGATIPGRRGKDIAAFLQRTTNRLNLFAACFLAVLAAIPTLMLSGLSLQVPFAASSMLIAVSVSLETMRTIKGEMAIRGIESEKDNGFM